MIKQQPDNTIAIGFLSQKFKDSASNFDGMSVVSRFQKKSTQFNELVNNLTVSPKPMATDFQSNLGGAYSDTQSFVYSGQNYRDKSKKKLT